MARMIPSIISPDTKSTAERRVFRWFQEAPGTENWIVLHSLGLAEHIKLPYGEIDFLVIAPSLGMFALEVKGGRVKRENGIWYFTDKKGNTNSKERGPFDQARDGIHSLMKAVGEKADVAHYHVANTFYWSGVMFPDIDYDTVGVDEEPWQVFDCKDDGDVKSYIIRLAQGARQHVTELYEHFNEKKLPSVQDVKYLANLLRGDFDKAVAISAKIKYAEQELVELTQRQYRCVDQIEENRRAIVYGPAGTGKTLLAIRQVEKLIAEDKAVALICYNASIGNWFQAYFESKPEEQRPKFVGTFHKLLYDIVSKAGNRINIPADDYEKNLFYTETLPLMAADALLSNPMEFDEIVVDEAQDLIEEKYIDIFDLLIKKGFDLGRWKFFGDFSRQAIYNDRMNGQEMLELLEDRTAFVRCKLTENCRNTKQICQEMQTVTGFEAPDDLWSKVDGPPVEHKTYSSEEEAVEKLEELLLLLDEKHISSEQITILSPRRKVNSIVSKVEKCKIKDFSYSNIQNVTFSTIQSFKGLENVVIILVDVDTYDAEKLMYVALSRARSGLFILESKDAHTEYQGLMVRRLLNGR